MADAAGPFLVAAFVGGMAVLALRLPPLIGFLLAGFAANALGFGTDSDYAAQVEAIGTIGDLGVTLLLFTIGLKLRVQSLLRPEVWAAATIHIIGSTALLAVVVLALKVLGLGLLATLGPVEFLILGFALSFSSTVFAVKVLEARSELASLYGRVAVGVLIMQDIFAVFFLTASQGEVPSPWALLLFLLLPLSVVLRKGLEWVGHGEMQVLYGVLLALVVGYWLFDSLGVKGDLGALIVGMLLASSPAASGLSKALFNMKELFLVGFFLSIGLQSLPTVESLVIALALVLVLPLKSSLYLFLFSRFRLGARTSLLSTLSLSNYSEFGLIVASMAASLGWLDVEWVVVLAMALSVSFVLAAPLNSASEQIYRSVAPRIKRLERQDLHEADRPINVEGYDAVVLGMGRIGSGAYRRLSEEGWSVLGVDNSLDTVEERLAENLHVVEGDAANSEFWRKIVHASRLKLVVLAMPRHAGNVYALEQLRTQRFEGTVAAVVQYADEVETMKRLGADVLLNLYAEAGRGMADDVVRQYDLKPLLPSVDATDVDALVLGMGRVGSAAYWRMTEQRGWDILGIDSVPAVVERLRDDGCAVQLGNIDTMEFWNELLLGNRLQLVVVATPAHRTNTFAIEQLRERGYAGSIAAVAFSAEEVEPLKGAGATSVFNIYAGAGSKLVDRLAEVPTDDG